ncbi:MAG: carboxymuconolactone decarboxylase family protein, partial [Bacteroidota bacterium]
LKVHLNAALNVGCTVAEVQEIILQMAVYAGFPSAINGMNALKEVLAERKAKGIQDKEGKIISTKIPANKTRYEIGAAQLSKLDSSQVKILEEAYQNISPDLAKYVVEFAFADILARPALDLRNREIATVAALTVLGTASAQLKFHIQAGLQIGITPEEMAEIMILMSVYAGFPAAINGTNVLKEVLNTSSHEK